MCVCVRVCVCVDCVGAVAAAARELRPVEIVGVYEQQRETLEYELAVAKKEVCTMLPKSVFMCSA